MKWVHIIHIHITGRRKKKDIHRLHNTYLGPSLSLAGRAVNVTLFVKGP